MYVGGYMEGMFFSLGFETLGPFQLGRPYQEDELYRLLHILNTDRFFVGQNIYRTRWLIESTTAIETSFPSVAFKVKVKYGSLPFKSLLVVLTSIGKGQFDRAHLPVWSFWFIHLVFHFNESGSDSSVLVFLFQLWRFGSKKKPRCNVFHTSYGSWHSFLAVFNGEHSQRILKCCKKWNRSEEFVQIMQIWTS